MGENVVGGVLGLAQLVKTFLLADLYDRAHQPAAMAFVGPLGPFQRVLAELSMRAFRQQLEEAHAEREALAEELKYVYWSEKLPASRAEWRSDFAVKTNWNTNGQYVEYTVPEGPGLKSDGR